MEIFTVGELEGKRGFSSKPLFSRVVKVGEVQMGDFFVCVFNGILMVFNGVSCWLSFSLFILLANSAGVQAGKDRKSSYQSQPRQQPRAAGS